MSLKLIQGGRAARPQPRLSGAFLRRPEWPPPPREPESSFAAVLLGVGAAMLALLVLV